MHHIHRPIIGDEDGVRINLKQGNNRILVKVDHISGFWGFYASIRNLPEEEQDWAKLRNKEYKLVLSNSLYPKNAVVQCLVKTMPSYIIPSTASLAVFNLAGDKINDLQVKIGDMVKIPIPEGYEGVIIVKLQKVNDEAVQYNSLQMALVGDNNQNIKTIIDQARKISKSSGSALKNSLDLKATLTFLVDQMEGKVNTGSFGEEPAIQKIQTMIVACNALQTDSWNPSSLSGGIREWAYCSPIDGTSQPYSLYLPENYNPQKTYGLIVALHGYTNNEYGITKGFGDWRPNDLIIVGAYGRGDMGYRSIGEQDVLDIMERMKESFHIDPDRVYLTGISMGGMGTWRIGQFYADRFAAIAPFCGWSTPDFAENLQHVPMMIVHGDKDTSVPITLNLDIIARLKQLGYSYDYQILEGEGHDAWGGFVRRQRGLSFFEFLRKQRRDPWPMEVSWKTYYLRYGHAYWLQVRELVKPQTVGSIKAKLENNQNIKVSTSGIKSFSLDLTNPHLKQDGQLTVNIDGVNIGVSAGQKEVIFEKKTNWVLSDNHSSQGTITYQGGGMADLFMRPIIVVYGTKEANRSSILKMAAERFCNWAPDSDIPTGSKLGCFPIKADSELTAEELKSHNVLLLGNANENIITEKINAKLPVRFVGDNIEISGKEYLKSSLWLTCPNPLAPQNLIGIITLPFDTEAIKKFMSDSNISYRAYRFSHPIESFVTPDIMIYSSFYPSEVKNWWFSSHWDLINN